MTNYPFLLFNQTPESVRRIGSRGGKASARNRRARLNAALVESVRCRDLSDAQRPTAAEAIAALDAQFPWLRGAERSRSRRIPTPARTAPPKARAESQPDPGARGFFGSSA
jgi:hypothetical protein